MQARVLGPVDVVDGEGNTVALRGPMPARVLALLVANRPRQVTVEDLVVQLWPDGDLPADPVASLRTLVARVRSALGADAVMTQSGAYVLGEVDTDVARFEDLVERARRSSGSPSVTELWRHALELWRGPAFGDHAVLESIEPVAARLDELRAEATEAWFDARLASGEGRELVADVEVALSEFPLREGFRAQQMTVLARAGRPAEALRALQDFRSDLTEVGLEPSARLVELEGQIVSGDLPTTGARRTLRGYELGERLGEGAFAIVHEATQASVGRTVAIKQIRSSLADQPEFIRQFEAEAHLIARLEHPHIVPLYDYWREPGSAYLVMRHIDGGSLGGRLVDGPIGLDETVAAITQVATGLDVAHRAGVIHRDVKPANILLDGSGNAYLSDFGIAVDEASRVDPQAWLSHGSPAYASPEQLERREVGAPADVYALGVTAYESLTGRLPFPSETTMAGLLERQLNDPIPLIRSTRPELPAAVDAVIQRATAKAPADRYKSAGAFAHDLARAAGLEGDAELIEPEDRNPYKGLRAFDEADAADYAGRDRLVSRLLDTVNDSRAVLVVGPSGSGKSSAVRAGLLPALRQGRLAGSERWLTTTMIPGAAPFADLEAALLRVAVDPPADLTSWLAADSSGLARAVRRIIPGGRQLVVVIDQFEELFTLAPPAERQRFLDALLEATTDERSRVRIVATIRADFYDNPLRHPAFARMVEASTVSVHPLAADELELAITQPALSVGATFEPGLVAQVTSDVADQPGALPLLQYALTELYDEREGQTLTRAAYDRLGGVSGALARRAEEGYLVASDDEQVALRRVMTRLVSLGEGTEDTRRRVLRSELGSDGPTSNMLDRFGDARLLSFDRDPSTREQTVEVAHEALIREWPRLREWLSDDRDGLRVMRHLTDAAVGWESSGRQAGELYRGGRLEAAEEWAGDNADQLNETEGDFLAASSEQRLATEQLERERLAEQVQSNKRLRRRLSGAVVALALALVAGAVAFQQRSTANATAFESDVRRMASTAGLLGDESPQVAMLLAAESHKQSPNVETLGALQRTLTRTDGFLGYLQSGATYRGVASSPLGYLVAATDEGLEIWNIDSRSLAHTLELDSVGALVVSGDGSIVLVSGTGGALTVVDIASGEISAAIEVRAEVGALAASSEGSTFAAGLRDGSILLVDSAGETELLTVRPTGVVAMDFGPADQTIISVEGFGLVHSIKVSNADSVWELNHRDRVLAAGKELEDATDGDGLGIRWISLSADEREVWVFSSAISFALDATTGDPTKHLGELPVGDSALDLGAGRLLVEGLIFDTSSGELVQTLDPARAVGIAHDEQRKLAVLATATHLSLWSLDGDQLLAQALPREDGTFVSLEPGGTRLVSTNWPNGSLQIWDRGTGSRINPDLGADTFAAGWSPAGGFHSWHISTKETRNWDTNNFAERSVIPGQNWGAYATAFGDTHAVVGSSNLAGGFRVYDLSDGTLVVERMELADEFERLGLARRALTQISFSPDGSLFAVVGTGAAALYETDDWAFRTIVDVGKGGVTTAGWTRDSQTAVFQTADSVVHFVDPETLEETEPPIVAGGARLSWVGNHNLSFGSNDTLLVGHDSGLEVWDLTSRQQIGGPFPNAPNTLFSGTPAFDGTVGVTAIDEYLLIWNLDTDDWPDIACQAAGRNMTRTEWEQVGPTNTDYRATCPQWPIEE